MFERIDAPPLWGDRPLAIVGGGVSLDGFDFDRLKHHRVLAVKGAMFDLPFAAAGFGLDLARYNAWIDRFRLIEMPVYWAFEKNAAPTSKADNVHVIRRKDGLTCSNDPSFIYAGGSSGFGALQVAVLKGAKNIALFGFDYKPTNDRWHYNEKQYEQKRRQNPDNWRCWAMYYVRMIPELEKRNVECVNGSISSEIIAFPRMTPNDAADYLDRF